MASNDVVKIPNVSNLLIKCDHTSGESHSYVCFRYDTGEEHDHKKVWLKADLSHNNICNNMSANGKQPLGTYSMLTFKSTDVVHCTYSLDEQTIEMDVSASEFKRMFNESRPTRSRSTKMVDHIDRSMVADAMTVAPAQSAHNTDCEYNN